MTRTVLSLIMLGFLVAACQEPPPPAVSPAGTAPAVAGATAQPSPAQTGSGLAGAPDAAASTSLAAPLNQPNGPYTENVPPTSVNVNPPGTPAYVIAPGDPVGRRNAQYPRPGGGPAF